MPKNPLLERLRHHVTGAIERGEAEPIIEQTKAAHTPGPWRTYGSQVIAQRNPGGHKFLVAECSCDVGGNDICVANARLIAATPAMAEALQVLLNGLYAYRDLEGNSTAMAERDQARAALKLAGL